MDLHCVDWDWKISDSLSVKIGRRVSLLVLDPPCNLAIKKKTTLCIYVQVAFFGFDDFEAVDKWGYFMYIVWVFRVFAHIGK